MKTFKFRTGSSSVELLEKGKSIGIPHSSFQVLVTEICEVHAGLASPLHEQNT